MPPSRRLCWRLSPSRPRTARRAKAPAAEACSSTLPASWAKLVPAHDRSDDPQTLLVIGTDGSKAVESDCQVSSYRVPAEGAVVVVIGWRGSVGSGSFLPLSALKLRRGTFECFAGEARSRA